MYSLPLLVIFFALINRLAFAITIASRLSIIYSSISVYTHKAPNEGGTNIVVRFYWIRPLGNASLIERKPVGWYQKTPLKGLSIKTVYVKHSF